MIGFTGMMAAIPPLFFGLAGLAFDCSWPSPARSSSAGSRNAGGEDGAPPFIVTLGFLFILRGLTLALSIIFANRTIVSGIGDLAAQDPVVRFLFSGMFANELFTWAGKHGGSPPWTTGGRWSVASEGHPLVGVHRHCRLVSAHAHRFGNWNLRRRRRRQRREETSAYPCGA